MPKKPCFNYLKLVFQKKERLILWLAFLVALSGCQPNEPEVTHLENCVNHYKAESYRVASQSCELAAQQGESHAQWLLAQIYRFGLLKAGENPEKAFSWYLKAAEQGHIAAMREVGSGYLYGAGVEENYQLAHRWLSKSAKQGDSIAAFALGYMYFEGKGRDQDVGSAINWFKRAAVENHAMSMNNLAWIFATSSNKAYQSTKKANYWIKKMNEKMFEVPMFLDTKAAVLASQSEFQEAIKIQNLAISKLPDDTPESEMLEYQKHLESYLQNKPWKE